MELSEFARQVLFGTTLEDKLFSPDEITDERPGEALISPRQPGRPPHLRFKPVNSVKTEAPGLQRLENPRERGRLLHFFANHELLATELMALVLLRFPDAPRAFRRAVLQTLRDEQEHTRLYLARMRDCGIHFGEYPLSGYFWRAISGMQSPLDYVSGLSLTFEQANLDFARDFARAFQTIGDAATAGLLERIYRDEIGHVACGLKWFRRWKDERLSDWTAFCRQLKFPLSPSRAKGLGLNVEGRQAAGFDPVFIAELNVYSQSRGRTPNVFWFNPFAEGYIAKGKSFTPTRQQSLLAGDLSTLPQFLCRQDDIVLVNELPSVEFLSGLKQAGFALPQFIQLSGGGLDRNSELAGRKLATLQPWAWSPESVELFTPLFDKVAGEDRSPEERFNPAIAALYSKAWSAAFLRRFLQARPAECWLCTEEEAGVAVSTIEEALGAIARIRERGHHRVVVKEAIGLAGHNAIRLWEPELLDPQRKWMLRALENGRQLVVEPWLERLDDFSAQLEMTASGLRLCGYTGLINDLKGQFRANWAAANFQKRVPAAITDHFREPKDLAHRMQCLFQEIFARLQAELGTFRGPLGIDALVYRAADGRCRLKPIVEINPRYTMGRVTIELMGRASPGSQGCFQLVTPTMARQRGHSSLAAYAEWLQKQFPLQLAGEPVQKIVSGVICLNDPARVKTCLAIFRVAHRLSR